MDERVQPMEVQLFEDVTSSVRDCCYPIIVGRALISATSGPTDPQLRGFSSSRRLVVRVTLLLLLTLLHQSRFITVQLQTRVVCSDESR